MGGLDWLQWLQMFGQGAGAMGGAGGMGGMPSGIGLPDAGAVVPVAAPPPVTGGAMMPDAGAFMPGAWMPGAVTPAAAPAAATRPAAVRSVTPQLDTNTVMPGPDTFRPAALSNMPQLNTDDIMPGPKTFSWWDRNVGDIGDRLGKAWDKAWTEDKTGQTPAMKMLQGAGSMAGKLGAAPAATPLPAPSGAGAGGYKPSGQINAAQMALAREQARQLLMQRATLAAPWLRRLQQQQGGLMG